MTEKQLQAILADTGEIKTLLQKLVENTSPAGRAMRVLEIVGLVATISGLAAYLVEVIQWILMLRR